MRVAASNFRFHVEAEREDPHQGIGSSALFLIGLKAVVRDDHVPLLWKNEAIRDPSPFGIGGATQSFGSADRVTQDDHGRHVGEGGVVGLCLAFGDAHVGADLIAPFAMGHAAGDPIGDP